MSPSINAFLTSELDQPEYPLLFAKYFLNREDYIQRKESLLFFERSLSKNITYYDTENLQEIAEALEEITLNIINQEDTDSQITLDLLNLLPKSIIMLFSIVGVQWESFFKIITLYDNNIIYFDFCANLMSELLDIRSDQSTEIVHQFGAKLIHFGIFSEKAEYFFPSYKILLKSPIFDELSDCYQMIYQIAKDSLTLFKDSPRLLCQFWARLSNFHISSETDREFSIIVMEFLRAFNSSISDESSPIVYNADVTEVLVYFLCNRVDVLIDEDEVQLLLKSYVKLIKQLLISSPSNKITKDSIPVLMKLFYCNCTPDQLRYSVQFFMYKINKYVFPETQTASNEGNEENENENENGDTTTNNEEENDILKTVDDSNNENIHLLVASYLFVDIISYHPKEALPYISTHFVPLIEKLVQHALEVYDVFTSFISSSICNEIEYYDFFDKILNHLFNDTYEIRLGCYDIIISFGTVLNYLSGFIFPILIQNINEDRQNEFHWYLDCLYATFNPSLTFSDENSAKLYSFFESLLQNPDDNIKLKAALFVFKLMIMHSHIFAPLFQASLEILLENPEEDTIYYAFSKYIQYFGLKDIEDNFHALFSAANNYLDNEYKFMCAASLLKYVPETQKSPEAQQFYQSIVYNSELNLGEVSNLENLSHLIFIEEYFVIFFSDIHKKIRVLNNVRKDLLLGYCKISRKMLKNIPSSIMSDLESIALVVDTTFCSFLSKNIESIAQSNSELNPEDGINLLMQDMIFITHNSSILAEFGMMLAILSIDKVHIVTEMFLNLSTSGDYDILYSAMLFFEKALKYDQVSEDEIGEMIQFSIAALEGIRVDVHLNQLFNMISVMPQEVVVTQLWGSLIEFFEAILPSAKEFQCSISLLSAIFINFMGKNEELFNLQIASECLDHFPPFQRNKTMMFLDGIISLLTNDFPNEIKAKAIECINEYLSWNQNRTKFYKVSDEMDSYIVSNFSPQ